MIFDDLSNLKNYDVVSDKVLEFLYGANVETVQGKYDIEGETTGSVSVFYTKNHDDCVLEAHQKFIDIHMLEKGSERIDFVDKDNLTVQIPYDETRDIEFYDDPQTALNSVYLTPNKFAMFFPYEAHKPMMNYCCETSKEVRKIVIKIPV